MAGCMAYPAQAVFLKSRRRNMPHSAFKGSSNEKNTGTLQFLAVPLHHERKGGKTKRQVCAAISTFPLTCGWQHGISKHNAGCTHARTGFSRRAANAIAPPGNGKALEICNGRKGGRTCKKKAIWEQPLENALECDAFITWICIPAVPAPLLHHLPEPLEKCRMNARPGSKERRGKAAAHIIFS